MARKHMKKCSPSLAIKGEREGAEWVVREGVGAGGRNDPGIVCTMN
jgi:hypothetical protein